MQNREESREKREEQREERRVLAQLASGRACAALAFLIYFLPCFVLFLSFILGFFFVLFSRLRKFIRLAKIAHKLNLCFMSAVRGVPPPALPRSLPLSFSFCNSFALVLCSFRSRLRLAFVLVLLPTLFQFASDPSVDIFHLPSSIWHGATRAGNHISSNTGSKFR